MSNYQEVGMCLPRVAIYIMPNLQSDDNRHNKGEVISIDTRL